MESWVSDYELVEREEREMRTTNTTGDFQIAPEGVHLAICYRIIDLGTHFDEKWGNIKHLIRLHWELPNALMKVDNGEAKPFSITKQYTLSHHEKSNLRCDLESWYGKTFDTRELDAAGGFDPEKLLDRPCQLNVVHNESNGKTYANVKAIMPVAEGMTVPARVNQLFFFDLAQFDQSKFGSLTEKLQEFINKSEERSISGSHQIEDGGQTESVPVSAEDQEFEDDIPF